MARHLTNDDIDKRLEGSTIKRVGRYVNSSTHTEWMCLECNYSWPARWNSVKHKKKCPYCEKVKERKRSRKKEEEKKSRRPRSKYTKEEADAKLEELGFIRLDPWVNVSTENSFKCAKCGGVSKKAFKQFSRYKSCKHCHPRCISESSQEVDMILSERNIERMGEWKNGASKMDLKCMVCKKTWKQAFKYIKRGSGCPECANNHATPTSLYMGIVHTQKGYYLKPGVTSLDSMKSRYAYDSKASAGKPISIDQLRFYTQKESCLDLERDLIAFCRKILGEPEVGNEWFRLPDEDELDQILIYFKQITRGK